MSFEQNNQNNWEAAISVPQFRENLAPDQYMTAFAPCRNVGELSQFQGPAVPPQNFNTCQVVEGSHILIAPPGEAFRRQPSAQENIVNELKPATPSVERQMVKYTDGSSRELILNQTGEVTAVVNPDGSRWVRTAPAPNGYYHWEVYTEGGHYHQAGKDFVGKVNFDKGSGDFNVISRFDNNAGIPKHFVQHRDGSQEEYFEGTGVKTNRNADGTVVSEVYSAQHSRQIFSQIDPRTHKSTELYYIDKNEGHETRTYKDSNGNWHTESLNKAQAQPHSKTSHGTMDKPAPDSPKAKLNRFGIPNDSIALS